MSDKITEGSIAGSHGAAVYAILVGLALSGVVAAVVGLLPVMPLVGMEFGLVFIGIFLANLRLFILIYFVLRTSLEFFMEPTRVPVGGSSIQLVGIVGAAVLAGGLVYIIMNNVKIREMSIIGPMVLFLSVTFPVLLVLSPDKMIGIKDWVGIGSAFIMFVLVAVTFKTKRDLMLLLRVIMLSTIVPLVFGFYQLFTDTGNHATSGFNRINATFYHPNSYAFYLVVMILICIPLLIETRKNWERIFYGLLVPLMTLSLVFTYARAAWFALLFGIIILAVGRYRKMIVLMPIGVAALLFFIPSILERFQEALGFSHGYGSFYFRVELWRFLLPSVYDNPIVGVGMGGFSSYVEEGMGFGILPHNDYLRVLVDTGIVGLISYLAIWLGLARGALRSYARLHDKHFQMLALTVLAVVGAYLVNSATDNLFRFSLIQAYIWGLAGIVAAAVRIEYPSVAPEKKPAAPPEEIGPADLATVQF